MGFGARIVGMANKVFTIVKPHIPAICVVGGTMGVLGGTFLACKATLKLDDILDEHNADLARIEEASEKISKEIYSKDDIKHDRLQVYAATAGKLAREYGPAIGLSILGFGSIFYGFGMVKKWHTLAVAATTALDQKFAAYRENVIAEYGYDADDTFSKERIPVEHYDISYEDPKTKETVTTEVVTINVDDVCDNDFVYCFDYRNPLWETVYDGCGGAEGNPNYDMTELSCYIMCALEPFAKGRTNHMFLNDILEKLAFDINGVGHDFGWINDTLDPTLDMSYVLSNIFTITPFVRSFEYDNVSETQVIPISDLNDTNLLDVFRLNYESDETSVGYIIHFNVYSDNYGIPREIYSKVYGN